MIEFSPSWVNTWTPTRRPKSGWRSGRATTPTASPSPSPRPPSLPSPQPCSPIPKPGLTLISSRCCNELQTFSNHYLFVKHQWAYAVGCVAKTSYNLAYNLEILVGSKIGLRAFQFAWIMMNFCVFPPAEGADCRECYFPSRIPNPLYLVKW